ncbi:polycystic kidney disease protein 1-like 3 [Delphinapterus leucas]|uniref:Polycystic kidney disease protein 1-like 3 n=1 Tax=Delphinapterus leucas TaxID=9749 RepID=A0A2Y9P9G0_DELLE|nr:polycystic kidney disease protein 1-like 3 [Delphinapterus leucas]
MYRILQVAVNSPACSEKTIILQVLGPVSSDWENLTSSSVVPENHHHFHSYLLRVLRRLAANCKNSRNRWKCVFFPHSKGHPGDLPHIVSLTAAEQGAVLHEEKEHQTKRILAVLARCPSSLPGSRDENNPIYIAPAMNGPVKCPERTLKEKKFFKLTGDILVQILFLILLMTAVYSAHNSNRFYLRQAIHKSFPYRFSEIKLLKHSYPWASSTVLPNLYRDYRVLFQFNLLFGWSISDYRTCLSSAVTVVGLLMGISHHKEVIALNPVLSSFLILLTSAVLMVFVINLFVSAILMTFGKERKSFKTQKEAALMVMLLLKLSSLLGIQQHQNT